MDGCENCGDMSHVTMDEIVNFLDKHCDGMPMEEPVNRSSLAVAIIRNFNVFRIPAGGKVR